MYRYIYLYIHVDIYKGGGDTQPEVARGRVVRGEVLAVVAGVLGAVAATGGRRILDGLQV